MLLKTIILLLMLFVIYNLGSGLYFLMKDRGQSTRVVKALTWRVGLSLAVFIILVLAYGMGWIKPHAV